jgi:hypothetical protein
MAFSNILIREDKYFTTFSQITDKIQEPPNVLIKMIQSTSRNFESYSRPIKTIQHGYRRGCRYRLDQKIIDGNMGRSGQIRLDLGF